MRTTLASAPTNSDVTLGYIILVVQIQAASMEGDQDGGWSIAGLGRRL